MKLLDNQFFTNIEIVGDYIYERYIDYDGEEKFRKIKYKPTLFLQTHAKTKFKDIYGNYCSPKSFDSITDANRWKYQVRDELDVLGMDRFDIAYLSDAYEGEIDYDMKYIRIARFDIEVTTDGEFPDPYEAKYPIDAITLFDSLDDKIYVYDLIEDKKYGVERVEPWRPDYNESTSEVLDKVVYKKYTCSDTLLLDFMRYIREKMPAILTGWNSSGFDIPYIVNRIRRVFGEEQIKLLSPYGHIRERVKYNQFDRPYYTYNISGISHLDYMEVYKDYRFKPQPTYNLDYISKQETGRGKKEYQGPIHTLRRGNYLPSVQPDLDMSDGLSKWLYIKYKINSFYERKIFNGKFFDFLDKYLQEPNVGDVPDPLIKVVDLIDEHNYKLDSNEFERLGYIKDRVFEIYSAESHRRYITYAIEDAVLLKEMDDNLSFLELVFDISYSAKMPFEMTSSKLMIWDAILYNSLKERDIVIPMNEIPEHNERIVGAYVKDPIVGTYRYVVSMDLTSLYPMIMLQGNISPEMLVGSFDVYPLEDYINKTAPRPSDIYSCSPNGWMYSKETMGFIPQEVLKVFTQRKKLRREQLNAESNAEEIKAILNDRGDNIDFDIHIDYNNYNLFERFDEETKDRLRKYSTKSLREFEKLLRAEAKKKDTGQQNRKILINSVYGATANKYFRYMDNRNASAVTMYGQLIIQWAERKINETMNEILGTNGEVYVFYIDTDSIYINMEGLMEKVGIENFRDTNHAVDFLDKFTETKLTPMLKDAFEELTEYMNGMKTYMNMDREVIAMPDIHSEGLGAIWTGKKRYALNVYDEEGNRFATPQLKIMGIETQRSSTPKIVGDSLKESIRIMLQEGVRALQEYVDKFRNDFTLNYRNIDYKALAGVSTANNLEKYSDENNMPLKGCPGHVKGALAYNRIVEEYGVGNKIQEGTKIMILNLKESNPFKSDRIAWESGENIPYELNFILDHVDYMDVLNKHYFPALKRLTDAGNFSYEYEDMGGFDKFDELFF